MSAPLLCPGHDCPTRCNCGGRHQHVIPSPTCNHYPEFHCPAGCYGDDLECLTCGGTGLAQESTRES